MRTAICALVIILLVPEPAQAAWLLWKRSLITRKIEGVPRVIGTQGDTDRWELRNALDTRSECLAALREEFKKTYEGLLASYGGAAISQSPLAGGVAASLSVITESSPGASEKATQLSFDYAFWCLPPNVDPRTTTITVEKK